MDAVFIIILLLIIIAKALGRTPNSDTDRLGRVVGHATEYDKCPNCNTRNSQLPRGRGEIITRAGHYMARQYHVCSVCGTKGLWHRRLDQWVWTVNRSGVIGIGYHPQT